RDPDGFGVLVSDEKASVQLLAFPAAGSATITKTLKLDAGSDTECDFEGAAFTDGFFYLTGSHGVTKKKGKIEKSRSRVYRFKIAASGTAIESVGKSTLSNLIANDPVLSPFHRKSLQQSGINIEGLAAHRGQLYFGFRNPSIAGHGFVLEIAASALFNSAKPDYTLHKIKLDDGLGIRELAALPDGSFLVLTGNAGSEANKKFPKSENHHRGRGYHLFSWTPGAACQQVASIPVPPGKAEALLVLGQTANQSEFVVLYDSAPDGSPQRFTLTTPKT
ncbi:MAG: DUF3616 domain-containing protein, partial [Verrucomicrobiales bacterium]|nr:DUF3616 domain-containing protein [Verrucomicrobiales bacterium]